MNFRLNECPHRADCFERALNASLGYSRLRRMASEVSCAELDIDDPRGSASEVDKIVGDARADVVLRVIRAQGEIVVRLAADQPSVCFEPESCPSLITRRNLEQE